MGRPDDAIAYLDASLEIRKKMIRDDPLQPSWKSDLSEVYHQLGDTWTKKQDWRRAMDAYKNELDLHKTLLEQGASYWIKPGDLAEDYANVANTCLRSGDFKSAAVHWQNTLTFIAPSNARRPTTGRTPVPGTGGNADRNRVQRAAG